jgi:hypothetical protein
MGNKTRERKRQKTKVAADGTRQSDALLLEDDTVKGQEELRLEALLFGKKSQQPSFDIQATHDLEHLMDSDVCILDLIKKSFYTEFL